MAVQPPDARTAQGGSPDIVTSDQGGYQEGIYFWHKSMGAQSWEILFDRAFRRSQRLVSVRIFLRDISSSLLKVGFIEKEIDMKSRVSPLLFLSMFAAHAFAAEPADQFSRSNCFNNESITYNYFDPPEWRTVFSWHFENGTRRHYVTPNPPYIFGCYVGSGGYTMINGLYCPHYLTSATRHAGIHGAFASTEPNPDGNLTPGITTAWSVEGVHTTYFPGAGTYVVSRTYASDCNLHFEQFY